MPETTADQITTAAEAELRRWLPLASAGRCPSCGITIVPADDEDRGQVAGREVAIRRHAETCRWLREDAQLDIQHERPRA